MKPTERIVRGWGLVLLTVVLVLFGSCKYELIDEPTLNYNEKKNAADYSDFILPPQKVTASHGLSRIVELEWEKVSNAVQYHIYSAATPYDTFTKVSETKGDETQISIDEESGITKYYCVCAVNFYGTISSKSIVACGSTLSVPVITEIVSAQEGNSVTVNWWMDNCNQNTYEKIISYNISVYANESSNIKLQALTAPGSARAIGVDGLNSTTEYYFTVEAVHSNNKSKEISTRTSAQTAHRVIPEPPADLTVTQGESISEIKLTWKLPEQVWYRTSEGSSGFELRPLYFKVYRKPSSAPDSEFKPLDIVITPATYKAGEEATLTDPDSATLINGVQYDYYVKSFTGGEIPQGKEISAQTSETPITKGWKQGVPEFYINSSYTKPNEDSNIFSKITFAPVLVFETFGQNYKYVIVQSKKQLNSTSFDPNPLVIVFDSKPQLNSYIYEFNNPENEEGYYFYKLFICKNDASAQDYDSKKYQEIEASGKYLVTNDAEKIPVIEDFTVDDGYKNKYVLNWKYNPEYKYIIHYRDEGDLQEKTLELAADDSCFAGKSLGQIITKEHEAQPGTNRIYSLEASTGLSTIVKPGNAQNDVIYQTLGLPAPHIDTFDHDKITVTWDAVQSAGTVYTVSACYEDNQSIPLITAGSNSITLGDGETQVSFELNNPDGYDYAEISGKNIKFRVTASSQKHPSDTTEKEIDVCTLGPALTQTKAALIPNSNSIVVEWNEVRGAAGYIIKRVCYKKGNTSETPATSDIDTYYYDGSVIKANNETVDDSRVSVTKSGSRFTLMDKTKEPEDDTKSYEINQSRIAWGIPFDYFVIPVKADGTAPNFEYLQIPHHYGATTGYGFNVKAQKADDGEKQILEWTTPYIKSGDAPSIYYRKAGEASNSWQLIATAEQATQTTCSFTPKDKLSAYEYLVAYGKSDDALINKVPQSFIDDIKLGLSAKETRAEYSYANGVEEKANKGYLLSVSLSADKGSGYSEDVTWGEWDYANRAIGPDSAKVFIKNYNISSDYIEVATLDNQLHYVSAATCTNTTIDRINNRKINLYPTTLMDGTTTMPVTKGPLMVLRDAKHYYALELTKGQKTAMVEGDDIYAYRDINDKELVKCALLNMAYGFYLDAGGDAELTKVGEKYRYVNDSPKTIPSSQGGIATFSARDYQLFIGKYKVNVSMTNFTPLQQTPGKVSSSVLKISVPIAKFRIKGTADPYIFEFEETFTVNTFKADPKMPDSYEKTFTVNCPNKNTLEVKINGKSIDSEALNRRIYFPLQIDEDKWWFKESSYGWW